MTGSAGNCAALLSELQRVNTEISRLAREAGLSSLPEPGIPPVRVLLRIPVHPVGLRPVALHLCAGPTSYYLSVDPPAQLPLDPMRPESDVHRFLGAVPADQHELLVVWLSQVLFYLRGVQAGMEHAYSHVDVAGAVIESGSAAAVAAAQGIFHLASEVTRHVGEKLFRAASRLASQAGEGREQHDPKSG